MEHERRGVRVVSRTDLAKVRMEPKLGSKVWFGPRSGGWGWEPVSWEGWLVTIISALVLVATYALRRGQPDFAPAFFGLIGALILVCCLKGTSPGSAKEKEAFDRQRGQ